MSASPPLATVRDVRVSDLGAVYTINEAAIPHVNSISMGRFENFITDAAYFRVALLDSELAGYLVAFAPGAPYDSLNFLWFERQFSDFLYIDRIAVAASARRRGIASVLYADFFQFARSLTGLVTCEVNTRPVNAGSLAFHHGFGFREVGTQETDGGAKTVSLMAVELTAPE